MTTLVVNHEYPVLAYSFRRNELVNILYKLIVVYSGVDFVLNIHAVVIPCVIHVFKREQDIDIIYLSLDFYCLEADVYSEQFLYEFFCNDVFNRKYRFIVA